MDKYEKERIISAVRAEYRRLDAVCGVDSSACAIRLSSRMKRRLGSFSVIPQGLLRKRLEIAISERIAGDSELFTDVIRHEYAHLLVYLRHPRERHGHDAVWKAAAREVGCIPRASRRLDRLPG